MSCHFHFISAEWLKVRSSQLMWASTLLPPCMLFLVVLCQIWGVLSAVTAVAPPALYCLLFLYPLSCILQAYALLRVEWESQVWGFAKIRTHRQLLAKALLLLALNTAIFLLTAILYVLLWSYAKSCLEVALGSLFLLWPSWYGLLSLWVVCVYLGALHFGIGLRYWASKGVHVLAPLLLIPLGAYTPYAFLLKWWAVFGRWAVGAVAFPMMGERLIAPLILSSLIYSIGILTFNGKKLWNRV